MNPNEYRFYIREFINKPGHHTTGHILAYVDKTDVNQKYTGSVSFTLADCSRQIDLSFDLDGQDERDNSLHKLDLLIKSLQQFRKAFKAECVIQEERERIKERLAAEKAKQTGDTKKKGTITLAELRQQMSVENGS